jgi:transposase
MLEEKFHVTMTRFGITKMLHRRGLSYTRPTYTLKRANPQKQQEFQAELHSLKKQKDLSNT